MTSIRLKITISLNGNHALNATDLKALKAPLERSIAACLPESIAVDTIRVTAIKDAQNERLINCFSDTSNR